MSALEIATWVVPVVGVVVLSRIDRAEKRRARRVLDDAKRPETRTPCPRRDR